MTSPQNQTTFPRQTRYNRKLPTTPQGDPAMDAFAARGCSLIRVPRTVDALQPVVNVVPLQLLSYHLTTLRCAGQAGAARARWLTARLRRRKA
jgi:hypothetical protein